MPGLDVRKVVSGIAGVNPDGEITEFSHSYTEEITYAECRRCEEVLIGGDT